jgi:diguanylate cyclase (GGDEF)-like protein
MPDISPEPTAQPSAAIGAADTERCLRAAGNAAYVWDVKTGKISWSKNAAEVLGCSTDSICSARQFANCLAADNITSREEVVLNSKLIDEGKGVPFQIEYQFHPDGRNDPRSIWLEDMGRWHAVELGRPGMVYGTLKRIDERHKRDQQLALIGTSDPLTGLFNRVRMTDLLEEAISNVNRERSSCAFAIAAVTNLSVVNESYGFEVADEVIAAVAQRLKQVMRSGDAVARYSGSKFGFVFNNCTSNDLSHALERLMAVVRDNVIETRRGPVWSTLSIGAVSIPECAKEAGAAIACAEEALSETRGATNDSYVVYSASESKTARHTLNARYATEVVRCLKDNTFKLAYQPVFDATSREIVMHEALLRLEDSIGGTIPAGHLIPVSEKIGLVKLIDRNVLQLAITTLHSYPDAKLAVNISGGSATDPRWNRQLIELLQTDASVARRVVVDLPELVALGNNSAARDFVSQLRQIGCRLAVDGFGSGYTSFHNMKDLPVDFVKIDSAFCQNLASSEDNRYFARCLIDLAKNFGIKTVAERVETGEDASILMDLGIDFLQGHYLAEASIDPPWSESQGAAFELAVPTQYSVSSEPVVQAPNDEPPKEAERKAPVETSATDGEYSFDDGLAKLRSTLDILNQHAA